MKFCFAYISPSTETHFFSHMTNILTLKRLRHELKNLKNDPPEDFTIHVENDNIFDWHFTLKGSPDSPFDEGLYHGKITFPPTYPMKPPDIFFFTPSGRFKTETKICLSVTSYHTENWQPSWNVRTLLSAVRAMFVQKAEGSHGGLDTNDEVRRDLAKESLRFCCPICEKTNYELFYGEKLIVDQVEADETESTIEENKEEKNKNVHKQHENQRNKILFLVFILIFAYLCKYKS
eukprot:TRINITY_DN2302_c0_g1_i1.p1 TRINITY_DN2302_c0_g1~~TRINITY_DN2302_c0_g1_i1.p1  ORF type:complete len:234 (+),score=47.77 TRINITY_DN2302_c0_g1_i1:94-795(+)